MTQNNIQCEKITWIDAIKGIGIILVVFGHALTKSFADVNIIYKILRNIVYMVHMPIFFIVGGYLFQMNIKKYSKESSKEFIRKKLKTYAILYLIFSIFAYAVEFAALKTGIGRSVFENAGYKILSIPELIKSVVLYISPVDNHLWFSYVMLLVIIISYGLKNANLRNFTILAGALYILTWPISFLEIIWKTMRYLFLFQVGRIFYEMKIEKIIHKKEAVSFVVFAFSFTIYMLLRTYKIYIPQAIARPMAEVSGVLFIIGLINKFNIGGGMEAARKVGFQDVPYISNASAISCASIGSAVW